MAELVNKVHVNTILDTLLPGEVPGKYDHLPIAITPDKRRENKSRPTDKQGNLIQRKVGPNKKSKAVIASIQYVMSLCEKHMETDIEALTPLQRVRLWADLQEYIRPKLARIEQTGEDGGPMRHNHTILLRPQASDIKLVASMPTAEVQKSLANDDDNALPEFPEYLVNVHTEEQGGVLVHNVSSQRQLPLFTEEQYINTIPETEAQEVKES
jgi:DNA-directed RNA polymerase beta subunit